jgi:hypothetical protein
MSDGLPLGGDPCRLVHSVDDGLVGSGTSSNVQWRKGTERSEIFSTSSYARTPADEEN